MKTFNKIGLIYNFAQHYRTAIFTLLDKELEVDFYFGNKMDGIKKMDYTLLSNFKRELTNVKLFSTIYWQRGAVSLFFKNYTQYVILGEYYCLSTWCMLLLSKFSNKKIYLWTHGWYGNESFIKKVVKKVFFNLSDGLFLYGDYAKKLMIKEGFRAENLHVIYNSLNYSNQLSVREKLHKTDIYSNYFKNDYPILIFIGRLSRGKKLEQLINAFKYLKEDGILINLVFVGTGTEDERLREKTKSMNNSVWFYGSCYDEEKIGELIYNAAICISPGNVGLTAMHSLVYGTPVITHSDFSSQMPEFEAINENVSGTFFIKDNETDLANKIKAWFSESKEREKTRLDCFQIIDEKYNPRFQLEVIKRVLTND
ncbi:glycosyltransferase [Flavobacterium caseinilyticum]|uniref:Glycosyltransferase n=1 Tax=Flavobacterium caseinilyticum TaxID=2541732 RepID=A0A4R5AY25_9FLAO|nr:glycosyltransferase [Flavobacterium caseinilyticum]TDD76989.1 glycosyltransferase [Flavobacterium caseinilyticum]